MEISNFVKKRNGLLVKDATKIYGFYHQAEGMNESEMTKWFFGVNFYSNEFQKLSIFPADL
ncbi:hypothetical protein [Emticicia sp. BO119]|uniref:hypothetical protein n=1 Tax=Emticicia sp. BO119 TaxID=2757768 RepID=UPI0015F08447|nr:hypothetical protein [Emticicia sp. BO119]MBA4853279.1 hypothetical protein [Emticicia sp. BO119]